jgi:hypothetical protein
VLSLKLDAAVVDRGSEPVKSLMLLEVLANGL